MKKLFFTTLSLFLFVFSFGQTTNQMAENADVKVEFTSQLPDNTNIITVTNKQNCSADITLMYNWDRVKTIDALSSDTFHIILYQSCILTVKSNPSCTSTTHDPISINLCSILPVKFNFFEVKRLNKDEFQIEFELAQITEIQILNIQISIDGKNFRTVDLLLNEDIKPNSRIIKKVKIK